jgi:hypothetical protein
MQLCPEGTFFFIKVLLLKKKAKNKKSDGPPCGSLNSPCPPCPPVGQGGQGGQGELRDPQGGHAASGQIIGF